jgi:hypothetical protein
MTNGDDAMLLLAWIAGIAYFADAFAGWKPEVSGRVRLHIEALRFEAEHRTPRVPVAEVFGIGVMFGWSLLGLGLLLS